MKIIDIKNGTVTISTSDLYDILTYAEPEARRQADMPDGDNEWFQGRSEGFAKTADTFKEMRCQIQTHVDN